MSGSDLSATLRDRLARQISEWGKDLLPTDRRQRALYFKHTRSASLEISAPDLETAAELLTAGDVEFDVISAGSSDVGLSPLTLADDELMLVSGKTEQELATALRSLERKARETFSDRGFWTLYLGFGMLRWIDPDDNKPVLSPVVLVPVRLRRPAASEQARLSRYEDDAVLNPVLALKMQLDFGIALPAVDDDLSTIPDILELVADVIEDRPGWSVDARCVLTTFSFHKEAMYRDLVENSDAVEASPLVQLIALGADSPSMADFAFTPVSDDRLDDAVPPEKLVSILDADASQRKCILAAREGRSFVMDGPPGTGKSQTIANIIVELIANGRTVLFVSEKAAALDVVRKRLAEAQLGDFLFELHSHNATKKLVVAELARVLDDASPASRPAAGSPSLANSRKDLNEFASAMNEVRSDLRMSVFAALGRLTQLQSAPATSAHRKPAGLLTTDFAVSLDLADELALHWRPVAEGEAFVWRGIAHDEGGYALAQQMTNDAHDLAMAGTALATRSRAVDDDLNLRFPITTDGVGRRLAVLELLVKRHDVPAHWFTVADRTRISDTARRRQTQAEQFGAIAKQLHDRVGSDWARLDVDQYKTLRSLSPEANPDTWRPAATTSSSQLESLVAFLDNDSHLVALRDLGNQLARLFNIDPAGVTPQRVRQLARLASLGGSPNRPEAAWLSSNVQVALDEACSLLSVLVGAFRERQAAMESVFTPQALELDLIGLQARFRNVHTGLRRFGGSARADKKALKAATVTGRVDKSILARLDDAVQWQRTHRELLAREPGLAPRLGRYYRRAETDFQRVSNAIETAREAVSLAGRSVSHPALVAQLSLDGTPDPQLVALGNDYLEAHERWDSAMRRHVGTAADAVADFEFIQIAQWCLDRSRELRPGAAALSTIRELSGRDLTVDDGIDVLHRAAAATDLSVALFDTYDADVELLGPGYRGLDTNWPALQASVEWADNLGAVLGGPVGLDAAQSLAASSFTPEDLLPPFQEWTQRVADFESHFEPRRLHELREVLGGDIGVAARVAETMAAHGTTDIPEWFAHQTARRGLARQGLAALSDSLERTRCISGQVRPAIERALLTSWVDHVADTDSRLRNYRADGRDALVAKFRDLDRASVEAAHFRVASACFERRAHVDLPQHEAIIRREGQKKARHKPIRQLLADTGALVQSLKPCFMMSPLSVSQYLPRGIEFDVCIFDEASQILPADSVNSVYRASQLIVAGDQKQLPPTSFFSASAEEDLEDTEEDVDVFESLLDLAKAAGVLRSLPLTWHYRSQHEALITYSNHRFYEGGLHTFPGAAYEAPDLGVLLIPVKGVYRRGTSRDNPIEARKVVDRIAEHRRRHPDLSLGVVTFSTAQEDAVVQAIEERVQSEPILSDLLADESRLDGFFVKSLESVQGDERDIILFTIGYGPDEVGKLTNQFGPINRRGGWRRLNVAITRARRRVEVISSIRAGDMADSANESVRHLRGYLDFAERGNAALALNLTGSLGDADSPFEEDVIQVIRSWGYDCVPQVGAAGYRIDIGVQHPTRPGSYVLAVECDGAAYHSSKVARDRDRLREQVLRGLGWRVHRIWGLSWYRERESQTALLRMAIEDAIAGRSEGVASQRTAAVAVATASNTNTSIPQARPRPRPASSPKGGTEAPPPSVRRRDRGLVSASHAAVMPEWATAYIECHPGLLYRGDLSSPEARPELRRFFQQVLAVEAPIHYELLMRRLSEASGGALSSAIERNAGAALEAATVDGRRVLRDDSRFCRVISRRFIGVRGVRDSVGRRNPEHVPVEEVENAIVAYLRQVRQASPPDVRMIVAAVFAWSDTSLARTGVDQCVQNLINQGVVTRPGSGLLAVSDE